MGQFADQLPPVKHDFGFIAWGAARGVQGLSLKCSFPWSARRFAILGRESRRVGIVSGPAGWHAKADFAVAPASGTGINGDVNSPVLKAAAVVWVAWVLCGCQSVRRSGEGGGFSVVETNGVLRIAHGSTLVSEYHYADVSRPFLYPLLGPDGVHMTRRWPQEDVGGEEKDHPHHHALWWSHGAANGADFWSEVAGAGKTVHQSFIQRGIEGSGAAEKAVVASRNRWIAQGGKVVAEDERRMVFHAPTADVRQVDFEITVRPVGGPLVLGDTKEGTFAIRLAETMRLKRADKSKGGTILNSRGQRDGDTWGKRAEWCDYSGPVTGSHGTATYGVTIFDHPANPRHPTWWHVRDYGLFAANPFGIHDFEKKPPGTGNLTVEPGQSLTFRYRVILHRGDSQAVPLEALYRSYAAEKVLK